MIDWIATGFGIAGSLGGLGGLTALLTYRRAVRVERSQQRRAMVEQAEGLVQTSLSMVEPLHARVEQLQAQVLALEEIIVRLREEVLQLRLLKANLEGTLVRFREQAADDRDRVDRLMGELKLMRTEL